MKRICLCAFAFFLLSAPARVDAQAVRARQDDASESARVAIWSPNATAEDRLRVARTLLDRGFSDLAQDELRAIEPEFQNASDADCDAFDALAIEIALRSARLDSPQERANLDVAVREIARDALAGNLARPRSALAFVRVEYALAALDDASDADSLRSRALDGVKSVSQRFASDLPVQEARVFLFWRAKVALLDAADLKRFDDAEKFAEALARSSKAALDENYFNARVLLVQIARERGNLESAVKRVAETLDELKSIDERPDAPKEIAVALVAEELGVLTLEKKPFDAAKLAARDRDLLDAPLPPNRKRYVDRYPDAFDALELARAQAYWNALDALDAGARPDDATTNVDELEKALRSDARAATARLSSNVARAFGARLARDVVSAAEDRGDYATLRATADDAYRAGQWRSSLDAYDRAREVAERAGETENAYESESVAAALVDKICREKLYEKDATLGGDGDSWRADAAARLEKLARERADAPRAESFFALALDYRAALGEGEDDATFEYLRLFPQGRGRASRATRLASRLVAQSRFEDAERALDLAREGADALDEILEMERAIYRARVAAGEAREESWLRAASRVLSAVDGRAPDASFEALASRLASLELTDENRARVESTARAFFALAGDPNVAKPREFLESCAKTISNLSDKVASRETRANFDAAALSLALESRDVDAAVALVAKSGKNATADFDQIARVLAFAREAESAETRERLARFALDSIDGSRENSSRATLLRAEAKRLLGARQEALNLFASVFKSDRRAVDAARGIARILESSNDPKTLERALTYWSDVADLEPESSAEWWDAKERCVEIYCKLGRASQARKMLDALWLTREDRTDRTRKARWTRMIENAEKSR